jgi:hypothetical protein
MLVNAQNARTTSVFQFRRATAEKVLEVAFHGCRRDVFALAEAAAVNPIPVQLVDLATECLGGALPSEDAWQLQAKVAAARPAPPFVGQQLKKYVPCTPALMPDLAPVRVFES